jgi:hypothetical protein
VIDDALAVQASGARVIAIVVVGGIDVVRWHSSSTFVRANDCVKGWMADKRVVESSAAEYSGTYLEKVQALRKSVDQYVLLRVSLGRSLAMYWSLESRVTRVLASNRSAFVVHGFPLCSSVPSVVKALELTARTTISADRRTVFSTRYFRRTTAAAHLFRVSL